MALSCPAPKQCEYGHKMPSGSLGSAPNPTPVSEGRTSKNMPRLIHQGVHDNHPILHSMSWDSTNDSRPKVYSNPLPP